MAINTEANTENATCLSCQVVDEYVTLANEFTKDLSGALFPSMLVIFISLVGLWVVVQGIRLAINSTTIHDIFQNFIYIIIAAFLLGFQGEELVNMIFTAVLKMMGAASSIALQVGLQENIPVKEYTSIGGGLHDLMFVAERAIMKIINLGSYIASNVTISNPMLIVYALILIIPYFILWIVYFAQVVITIFRTMILAVLSPFMFLGFAFGWGRDMLKSGIRTIISSFIVLFSSTAVIAVLLYAVSKLDIGEMHEDGALSFASLSNVNFLLTVAMGWLGTAFMTEATGLANSITGSNFTNNAAGTIVAGAAGSALALGKAPGIGGLTGLAGAGAGKAAQGVGYGFGAINTSSEEFRKRVAEKIAQARKS